jgi:hypothetical protein
MKKLLIMPPYFAERFARYILSVYKIAAEQNNVAGFFLFLPSVLLKAVRVSWMRTCQWHGVPLSARQLKLAAELDG